MMLRINYFVLGGLLLMSIKSWSLDARAVMEKVDQQQRESSHSSFSRSVLSSCNFKVVNKKVSCASEPRIKKLESVSKQYGQHKKDSRAISIVLEPVADKGIGMLTYSYDDDDKETESWLYLSALGKVKRMASSSEDKEPVAFFGSEFTTEDMESGKTDEYHYKILQQGKYSDRPVWVIEAKPKEKRLNNTRYSKILFWVDQARYLVLKAQPYDKRGKSWKRIMAKQIEKMSGFWIARELQVYNLKTKRMSRLITEEMTLGLDVADEFLTQRTLTDFAFREKALGVLRASAR